jgi:hypothetical protein
MTKNFPTVSVLTVSTGVMLEKGADFQSVMDHFFPGIFTLGCVAMQPTAAKEIYRQLPEVKAFADFWGEINADNCEAFLCATIERYGETLPLDGPLDVSNEQIESAFANLKDHP